MTKYALISVSDKSNLEILVDYLYVKDYTILSTGGTFKYIYDTNQYMLPDLIQCITVGYKQILVSDLNTSKYAEIRMYFV